jgi:class 3 adenylate cyclase/predicted ATPase
MASSATAAPEFRRLTVLFCDLIGSVELANQRDPEDWHALLATYQAAAGDAIRRHHGHVAQYLGDGIVAYFGFPLAGEDDAACAVRAALELVTAVSALHLGPDGAPLRVRVGLHTGAVVMGEVGSGGQREYLALGDTPNIAARLQALAASNCVVASAATHSVVQSQFRCLDLGDQVLKGLAAPLRVYRIVGTRQGEGDEDWATSRQAPLQGRQGELERLLAHWRAARTAAGRCLLLVGEPGIGKSRLARELRLRAERDGANVWLMRCSAHRINTPFAPMAQLLERAIGSSTARPAAADEPPSDDARALALAAMLSGLGVDDPALLAPLAAMLGITLPDAQAAPPLSAQALRERTFDAATAVVRAGAAKRPTLLVVEDLHWADPTTLEWLHRVLSRDIDHALMLVLTARSEFQASWPVDAPVERLALDPCTPDQASALVHALDAARSLTDHAVERIVARAEGNPLFIEEFTRSALESGGEDIPATLQEQTLARLDRLGVAKAVLQQAAVIGRRFARRRLRAVTGLDDATLSSALQRGIDAHLLTPLADGGGELFAFRHALLQDAAYASLLRSARQSCHLRAAQALLAEDASAADKQPEALAHHYTEAGQLQPAIVLWLRAAQLALSRSACLEAAAHARRALGLLSEARPDDTTRAQELELQLVMAPALMTVHGVLDPQVERAYTRARVLCEAIGNTPKLLVPLWGLWAYELMRGHVDDARAISGRLGDLARQASQPMPRLVAAATTGMTRFYQGELAAARAAFAEGIALYRTPRHAARSVRGVHDPGVMCHAFDMLACWLTGEGDAAQAGAERLRDMAPTLAPYDAAFLWCADALLAQLARDVATTRASAARGIAIAEEQAFNAWEMMGSVLQGWGLAMEGPSRAGIDQMQRGFDAWCATGARNLRPLFQALLADAWLAAGDAQRALQSAEAGIASASSGERVWVPELHRLRALALLQQGQRDPARHELHAAITLAEQMGARAWRQRAEADLAHVSHGERSSA